jgi:hypothetical protein
MATQSLVLYVWLIGLVFQVFLVGVLLAKKTWTKFPMFFAYAGYTLGETAVLLAIRGTRSLYFYSYIVGESVSVILGLSLVCEMFTHLFSLQPALRKLARISFRVAVVLVVLFAGAVIYSHSPIGRQGVGSAILLVEEAARVLEVGLITFLFLFSTVFGLHWRQSIFGIALGFGIPCVGELFAVTLAPHVGVATRQFLNLGQLVAFDFGLLIWLGYAALPERATGTAEMPQRAQLEQWNQAIMELINQ